MKIKRNIRFSLHVKNKGNDEHPIRMRVTWGSNRADVHLPYAVSATCWDTTTRRVQDGTKNSLQETAKEINGLISDYDRYVDDVFARFELVEKTVPTVSQFREAFDRARGREPKKEAAKEKTFFDVWDEFIRTQGLLNTWSADTYRKFGNVRKHLETYNARLSLDHLSEETLHGYIQYLLYTAKLRNTTVDKNLSFLRWFLRWAAQHEYYKGRLHETFRPRLKGTDGNNREVIHLTWDELLILYKFKFPEGKKYLARVRDVFCFCCFTSLRYSDVEKLRWSDIHGDYINTVTKKTVDSLRIELNEYSRALIEKYRGTELKDDKVFPVVTNQRMNDYLKEMGKIAGLDESQRIIYYQGNERVEEVHPKYELLTTHCGRRTFVVNALWLGIPESVIMEWTGHSDYKAMAPYRKIVNDLKEREMDKFNHEGPRKRVPKKAPKNGNL